MIIFFKITKKTHTYVLFPSNYLFPIAKYLIKNKHYYILSYYEIDYFKYLIYVESHNFFFFCDWFIWLSILYSKFIYVVANGSIFFFLSLNNIPLNKYTTFSISIHLTVDTENTNWLSVSGAWEKWVVGF